MTTRLNTMDRTRQPKRNCTRALLSAAACTVVLAACGASSKDKAASQTAVRVNKEEVTVHQINLMLQQQRGLKADQVDARSKQILEFLVDQELAVQKTRELKIDQDPRVMLQLESAKREVLARAYAERVGESAAKPTAEEIKKYFDGQPALFKARRIYNLMELTVEAKPEQLPALRAQLQRMKSAGEFAEYLRANNIRFNGNQGVRAAEQLPAEVLNQVAQLQDNQMVLLPAPTGAVVLALVSSRAEPIDEVRATPAIEQALLNDAKRKRLEADLKDMRAAAKIEYMGKFAASSAAPTPTPPVVPGAPAAAASGLSAEDIAKGMGIKK
jgi:EpsD family peptidyl-prolyl cis-trans isomerase